MAETSKSAAAEWRAGWPLVFASMLAVTWVAAPTVSMGIFLEPLEKGLNWKSTDVSLGMTIYAIVSVLLVPFAGALVDRVGTRTIALPGLALNGLAFAAFGFMTPSLWHWAGAWFLYTITQLMIGTFVWNGAVSAGFMKSRGLAIGLTMGGVAVGQLVAPFVARWLIDAYGWRIAFAAIGICWPGIVLIVAIFLFHDPRTGRNSVEAAAARQTQAQQGGVTFGEALRSPRFLRIALAILLQSMIISGMIFLLVAMMHKWQVDPVVATAMLSALGVLAFAGQLVTGWLADRVTSTLLPVSCFAISALGCLTLLAGKGNLNLMWLAVVLLGYASGACINITTYLTTRYMGLRHFGKIYGVISSGMRIGAGVGPLIGAAIVERAHGYEPYLIFAASATGLAALSVLGLGPYPVFKQSDEAEVFA